MAQKWAPEWINWWVDSCKHTKNYGKIHHVSLENLLFLWWFSHQFFVCLPGRVLSLPWFNGVGEWFLMESPSHLILLQAQTQVGMVHDLEAESLFGWKNMPLKHRTQTHICIYMYIYVYIYIWLIICNTYIIYDMYMYIDTVYAWCFNLIFLGSWSDRILGMRWIWWIDPWLPRLEDDAQNWGNSQWIGLRENLQETMVFTI
jgi:hypothetical protein